MKRPYLSDCEAVECFAHRRANPLSWPISVILTSVVLLAALLLQAGTADAIEPFPRGIRIEQIRTMDGATITFASVAGDRRW